MHRWMVAIVVGFIITLSARTHTTATQFLFDSLHGPSTTTISPHISDYRKQSRSDSRADKPDSFPGFDAAGNAPRRPRHRSATEFYTQLFGKIIGNIGVDNIVDKVERKHDKLQRLSRLARMRHAELGDGLLQLKGLRPRPDVTTTTTTTTGPPTTTEFVGLSLDDEYFDYDAAEDGTGQKENLQQVVQTFDSDAENAKTISSQYAIGVPAVFAIPGRYVSSLWTHIFANQLRSTAVAAEQRAKQQQHVHLQQLREDSTTFQDGDAGAEPATASTYLVKPLRSIWDTVLATKSLYVNWPNPQTSSDALRVMDEHAATPPPPAAAASVDSDGKESMVEFTSDGINVHNSSSSSNDANGIHKQSYQLQQSTPSDVDRVPATETTPSSIGERISAGIRSKLVRAKLAFENAFYKYSSVTNRTREDKTAPMESVSMKITMRRPMAAGSTEMWTTKTSVQHQPSRTAGTNDDTESGRRSSGDNGDDDDDDYDVNTNTIAPGDETEVANLNTNAIDANGYAVVAANGVAVERAVNATHIYGDPGNNTVPDETNQRDRRVEVAGGGGDGGGEGIGTTTPVITSGDGGSADGSRTGDDEYDYGEVDDETGTFEGVGIFVLEIFGTLLGLGWGLFNQIQNLWS